MNDDDLIISSYKEAFSKYPKDGVIDMDLTNNPYPYPVQFHWATIRY